LPATWVGEPNANPEGNTDVAVTEPSVDGWGVTFTALDAALLPIALLSTTEQVYSVPLVNPVTATDVPATGAVFEVVPAKHVAVPPLISDPPSLDLVKVREI
jgi:hypothetical protein